MTRLADEIVDAMREFGPYVAETRFDGLDSVYVQFRWKGRGDGVVVGVCELQASKYTGGREEFVRLRCRQAHETYERQHALHALKTGETV